MIGRSLAHYCILERLGEGGMGVVYKARDTHLDRLVAIKVLRPDKVGDPDRRRRFVQEARAASALAHPNIIVIHDILEEGGVNFVVMEYVRGRTLADLIARTGLPPSQVLLLAVQIADALGKAHDAGIVHRDLKPGNVMVDEDGRVRLVDFGLAKLTDPLPLAAGSNATTVDRTEEGRILGTVAYMSPEQVEGRPVDGRSDIFAFGAVLYEMLTGRKLYQRESTAASLAAILRADPPPVGAVAPELAAIARRCLQRNPDDRFHSARQLKLALEAAQREMQRPAAGVSAARVPSIAVLPFSDMSPLKDQEYFCDGLAEEIIDALTHIRELRVVARTSAFAFKGKERDVREIGRALNVDSILEGSLRKAGDRLRITAQLVNVADGYHLWSERFDRKMEDVFAIQDEIALAVVDRLKVELLGGEKEKVLRRHTRNPEAYTEYLKARYFLARWTPDGLEKGLAHFQEVMARDPTFTAAYVGTAETFAGMGILGFAAPTDILPRAKEWLARALVVEPGAPEASFVSAVLSFWYDWDWNSAEAKFKQAFSHNPGHAAAHIWYAWYLAAMRRFDEAFEETRLAQNLDPMMPFIPASSVGIYVYAGEHARARAEFEKAIEMEPTNGLACFHMGTGYKIEREPEKAIELFRKAIQFGTGAGWAEASLGATYATIDMRDQAELFLRELLERRQHEYVSALCIAWVYDSLGEKEQALDWLDRAFQERDILVPLINIVPAFDHLVDEPRYQSLVKSLRFPS